VIFASGNRQDIGGFNRHVELAGRIIAPGKNGCDDYVCHQTGNAAKSVVTIRV